MNLRGLRGGGAGRFWRVPGEMGLVGGGGTVSEIYKKCATVCIITTNNGK